MITEEKRKELLAGLTALFKNFTEEDSDRYDEANFDSIVCGWVMAQGVSPIDALEFSYTREAVKTWIQ